MSTTCPERGRLRAWLDQEAGEDAGTLAEHLTGCAACQATRDALDRDAVTAARVLNTMAGAPPTATETEQALARLHRQLDAPSDRLNGLAPAPLDATVAQDPRPDRTITTSRRFPVPMTLVFQRWRLGLAGLAAALALTFVLATPEGRVAAAGFLAQFRSQRLTVVTFDPNQTRQTGLFRLEHLGTVTNPRPPQPTTLANVKEAGDKAGFPILQPDLATLPAGAGQTPKVRFSPATETRLTFDKQKVRIYFDSIGRADAALPDKLNGATLVVALPPVVMLEYPSADNKPAVAIGQAREIQVGVEGNASLDEVRTFLLTLPNLPEDLGRQLRSIQDWRSTLPIPVPMDKISWEETKVNGASGYLLNDNTGLGSAIIWQKDGRILGVAGPMKASDLRKVAESLK